MFSLTIDLESNSIQTQFKLNPNSILALVHYFLAIFGSFDSFSSVFRDSAAFSGHLEKKSLILAKS